VASAPARRAAAASVILAALFHFTEMSHQCRRNLDGRGSAKFPEDPIFVLRDLRVFRALRGEYPSAL